MITLDEIPAAGYTWRVSELPSEVRLLADSYVDAWEPELAANRQRDPTSSAGRSHGPWRWRSTATPSWASSSPRTH